MRLYRGFGFLAFVAVLCAGPAEAQLGQLLSPGPLSKAHAQLEGSANCKKCHEAGKQVSAARCLQCHQPVAARIAQRKGVHREVKDDCVSCHVEHNGRDAELRPFDTKAFDHLRETGFALDGRHAGLSCDKCHKTRSFLGLSAACASCHADAHKGRLGTDCAKCHATSVAFKTTSTQFDHSRTAFPLDGAHRSVACAKCHVNQRYSGLQFRSCADCHANPHKSAVGHECSSCHNVASWHVANFDHARTGTPLAGKHQTVACAKCHVQPATQVRINLKPCASCHKDPHRSAFKDDCSSCHSEQGFKGAPFNHDVRTRFPLQGKHRTLVCAQCHKQTATRAGATDFRGLKMECAACHTDPHRGQFGGACEKCHTAAEFRIATYNHPLFKAFFVGQHATAACDRCHRGAMQTRVYRALSTECVTCHKDVHAGQFAQKPCTNCHAIDAPKFAPTLFRHDATAFALTGKHQAVACHDCHKQEGQIVRLKGTTNQCASCHKDVHLGQMTGACSTCHATDSFHIAAYKHRNPGNFFRGKHATAQCADCHKKTAGRFPAGEGMAVRFTGLRSSCANCHADPHRGQMGTVCERCHDAAAKWSTTSRAFHKAGTFPLEGRHLTVPCADCHRNGIVKGTPTACYDCHAIRRQDDKFHQRLGNACEECHRPTAWTAVNWDHAARTGLALNAAHRALGCDDCHRAAFGAVPSDCSACHLHNYDATTEPNHRAAGFPLTCQLCHHASDPSWQGIQFTHSSFALAGVHAAQSCASCHKKNIYKGTSRDCSGCHKADYDRTQSPAHAAAGFPTTCDSCHRYVDAAWTDAKFVHSAWPLVGQHASANCAACHKSNVYRGLSTQCNACHAADYQASKNPSHAAAGFPTTCDTCHHLADASWNVAKFDHSTFPLAGAHTTQACSACHRNGVYRGTMRVCSGCHQSAFDASKSPNHAAAGFSPVCEPCHKFSDMQWTDAKYDHSFWPLLGQHVHPECAVCHAQGVYKGMSADCFSCHAPDFNKTSNPNHTSAGFPTSCQACHKISDVSWLVAVFSHSTFPLAGQHASADCSACHKNNVFAGTSRTCSGCHQTEYVNTKSPNHASAGFPTTCDSCHKFSDPNWLAATFSHSSFPLAGVHATQTCDTCHKNNVYAGTPRTCSGCHQTDYVNTKSPNHAAAGFPTTCDACHKFSDPNWLAAAFTHSTFPLAGVHATQPCGACHKNNVYAGTPRTCSGCHQTDYNNARNPNHVTAGFPNTCDACHKFSDASWQQGLFTHSTFPLAGVHATQPCGACHKNGVYQGTPRTCAGCHQALYNSSQNPNHIAAGFPTTCEICHRFSDTSWQQGVFTHSTFPLAGVHATQPCGACHKNGVYQGTPRTCSGCHLALYNSAQNPNHIAAGFPTTCEICHKFADTSWQQGVFTHSTFPLAGAHLTQPCSACHKNNVYRGTPRTCVGCHLADYNGAQNPNHVAAGFPTTCDTCHKFSDLSWNQAVFNHTWFPITSGPHAGHPCNACHTVANVFSSFSCTVCHGRAETDSHHTGVAGYRYDSVACYACHPTGRSN